MSASFINPYIFSRTSTNIAFVGVETGSAASFWSNTNTPKNFSINNINKYGTAGYVVIAPTVPEYNPSTLYQTAPVNNDLGASLASPFTSVVSIPPTCSIFGNSGNYVNFNGYASIYDPAGTTLMRSGGLSVNLNNGPYSTPAGSNTGYYGVAATINFNQVVNFRIGILVDTVADGAYAPNYVSVYSQGVGTIFSWVLSRNATPKLVFFDVNSYNGGQINIAMWQTSNINVSAFSLLTFDII